MMDSAPLIIPERPALICPAPKELWKPSKPFIIRDRKDASGVPGVSGVAGFTGAGKPAVAALTDTISNVANSASGVAYTFTSRPIGSASPDRVIIVAVFSNLLNNTSELPAVWSATLGGVAMTLRHQGDSTGGSNGDTANVAFFSLAYPTGTTATVTVTDSSGLTTLRCAIAIWAVTGLASHTPRDTDVVGANPLSGNINCPANGFVLGIATSSGGASAPGSWTGLTEVVDTSVENRVIMAATTNVIGAHSVTATVGGTQTIQACLALAAWR